MGSPINSNPIGGGGGTNPFIIRPSYWRSYEPYLDENYANFRNAPAQVNRGLFRGYTFPVWSTPANQYDELLFRIRVPFRWDGVTNPYFCAITAISQAEDIGDKYKFQLEWASEDVGHVIPDTTKETVTWEVVVIDGTAWRAEIIVGEMDASFDLIAGQNWQGRLRRIASDSPAVTGNPAIFHWCTRWLCNKIGTESDMGY